MLPPSAPRSHTTGQSAVGSVIGERSIEVIGFSGPMTILTAYAGSRLRAAEVSMPTPLSYRHRSHSIVLLPGEKLLRARSWRFDRPHEFRNIVMRSFVGQTTYADECLVTNLYGTEFKSGHLDYSSNRALRRAFSFRRQQLRLGVGSSKRDRTLQFRGNFGNWEIDNSRWPGEDAEAVCEGRFPFQKNIAGETRLTAAAQKHIPCGPSIWYSSASR